MSPSLIYETAIHRDPDTGDLYSYWPDRWPLDTLFEELFDSGSPFFGRSYMNDPAALQGNSLKVSWLHFYLPEHLTSARADARVERGFRYVGFDPSGGGKTADPDYFALGAAEVINNRGYLLDYHFDRRPVDEQAQIAEDWCDVWKPDYLLIEDIASEGHVYTAFTSQINSSQGSKYPIEVCTPQGSKTQGGKQIRLQSMGARFQNGQVLVPGIIRDNQLTYDPKWEAFVNQWRTFPAGHDDILDGFYWSLSKAFDAVTAAASATDPAHRHATPQDYNESPEKFRERTLKLLDGISGGTYSGIPEVPVTDRRGRPLRAMGVHRERSSWRMTH